MPSSSSALSQQPLDIVTACRAADVNVLKVTLAGLIRHVPFRQLHVFTAARNFPALRQALGNDVALIDEDQAIPGMTLDKLRQLSLPGFPKGAGWYFQQLLKYCFCFSTVEDDHFLIWDADTVPLRDLRFFDDSGRMLLAVSDEDHSPYFETYRQLLGEEPRREHSFISQHIIVQKSILREMLAQIEARFPGPESWAWKIMRNLKGNDTNLFSEYEMYGNYAKNHYPERVATRRLPWLRNGSLALNRLPTARDLERLSNDYAFAAFESSQMPLRRLSRWLRSLW